MLNDRAVQKVSLMLQLLQVYKIAIEEGRSIYGYPTFEENTRSSANNVFFQASQPFLCCLQYVVIFANGKAEIIFSDVSVRISVELRWRNGRDTDFLDKEPRELEIARPASYMWWEWVVFG